MSDAGLIVFKGCNNLQWLYLNDTAVSDAGLAHFKDCKNLSFLVLASTQVSDAGLAALAGCPKLVSLNVTNTKVTEAGVKKLSAALPGCKIEWDGGVIEPKVAIIGPVPPIAKAPFDAKQARTHQEAWAKHLGTTVETTNSVGAMMILIPPGEFLDLDIFWLKGTSLEDSDDLPAPDILAQEIADDLQTALEQFAAITEKVAG